MKKIKDDFLKVLSKLTIANPVRHPGIDPDNALRMANHKFRHRFSHIEEQLEKMGKSPQKASLAEMATLWKEAKELEKP